MRGWRGHGQVIEFLIPNGEDQCFLNLHLSHPFLLRQNRLRRLLGRPLGLPRVNGFRCPVEIELGQEDLAPNGGLGRIAVRLEELGLLKS